MAYFLSRRSSVGQKVEKQVQYKEDITSAPNSIYRDQGPESRRPIGSGSSARDGFYGVGADGHLYKSNLQAWNHIATPTPSLTSFAMRKDGVVFALATSRLCIFDPVSAEVRSIVGTVNYRGQPIKTIRGMTFSEQPDELWGIALNGTFPDVHTDALIRIDQYNGEIDRVTPLGRCDIMSLAAPPVAGGPWHGIAMFMWTNRGGLYGMKWANEGGRLVRASFFVFCS